MKKIASMVGVGAMVITFGMGSLYAQQQQTTQPAGTVHAVPGDAEKNKTPAAKPEGEVKADKAAPGTRSVAKDAGLSAKTGSEVKPELTAPAKPSDMKPGGQVKPEAVPSVKPTTEKTTSDTTTAKSSAAVKADKSADTKTATEVKPSKDAPTKPLDEKSSDKAGDTKPAKQ